MRKISFICLSLLAAICILYGAMYLRGQQFIAEQLSALGYPEAKPHVEVYFDGIIIDQVTLKNGSVLKDIYLQASPFQLLAHRIQSITVTSADLHISDEWDKPISFISNIPFTVDHLIAYTDIEGEKTIFNGSLKQNTPTSALFHFKGRNKYAHLKGQGELYFDKNQIQTINLDFSSINLTYETLKTKRADGWLSLSYKDQWLLNGEIGAGYADINQLELSDAVFTINGSTAHPVWTITGKDRKTAENISIEQSDQKIRTSVKKENNEYEADRYFSLNLFSSISKDIAESLKPLQVVEVRKIIPRRKLVQKLKPQTAYTQKEFATALEVIEADKKPFNELIANSLFSGLRYSKDLTIVSIPCMGNQMTNCWVARARSGVLTSDDSHVPEYLMRMKNYENSQALRFVLQKINIVSLTLYGSQKNVQKMIIIGKTDGDQPVHIELSVSDVT